MRITRFLSVLLILSLFALFPCSLHSSADDERTVRLLAASDFQNSSGSETGKAVVSRIVEQIKKSGVSHADGFLFCGDYDYSSYADQTLGKQGIESLKEAVSPLVTGSEVFVQGNHDCAIGTLGMSPSGNNDPASGEYGVYVINEDDYMWYNDSENTVKRSAQRLINYLNAKLDEGFDRPIFVVSHLGLHYNMRTKLDGDGMYAKYIFDPLNEAGAKGLNIIFLYGHNHSNGWDDYLGGACVYLKKGDEILIAEKSRVKFRSHTLNFTYMNPGYTGYYSKVNDGSDCTVTMSLFTISGNEVSVSRYDVKGIHDLKSAGVQNAYKQESGYKPDDTVYPSPQSVALTKVTDGTHIKDLAGSGLAGEGRVYRLTENVSELTDGGRYLLICDSEGSSYMIPSVVTKSNGSESRTGFDLLEAKEAGADYIVGDMSEREWVFTKDKSLWKIGDGEKYIAFSNSDEQKISAILDSKGNGFAVSGGSGSFTFSSGSTVLNYNSRGLINGYGSNPASFLLYRYIGYTVTATGGNAFSDVGDSVAMPGAKVVLKANVSEGEVFDHWESDPGIDLVFETDSGEISFIMPERAVSLKAVYREADSAGRQTADPGTSPAKKQDNTVLIIVIVSLISLSVPAAVFIIIKIRKTSGRNHG